jgi:hypothetical protein
MAIIKIDNLNFLFFYDINMPILIPDRFVQERLMFMVGKTASNLIQQKQDFQISALLKVP